MTKATINYREGRGAIIDVNCFKNDKFVANFSNFNNNFKSSEVKQFCENLSFNPMYDTINVSRIEAD